MMDMDAKMQYILQRTSEQRQVTYNAMCLVRDHYDELPTVFKRKMMEQLNEFSRTAQEIDTHITTMHKK